MPDSLNTQAAIGSGAWQNVARMLPIRPMQDAIQGINVWAGSHPAFGYDHARTAA